MKKYLLLIAASIFTYGLSAQLLHTLNINAVGGYDVILQVDEKFSVTVTAGGEIELVEVGWKVDPETFVMVEDNPWADNIGKLARIEDIPFDYFSVINTYDEGLFGKVRRIGNVFFEYYGDEDETVPEQYGKMKRAGYLYFDYYNPGNTPHEEKWGKISKIDFLSFDYYTAEDTEVPEKWGLLKTLDKYVYDYRIPKGGLDEDAGTIEMKGRKNINAYGVLIRVFNIL